MSKRKAVQFMWLHDDFNTGHTAGLLIEQLRYMGLLTVVRQTDEGFVLQAHEPRGVEAGGAWARQNAERMKSFGINAVVVEDKR